MVFSSSAVGKGLSLPCGRCIGCRLERARQWAVRIMHEVKMHDSSSFITLTYKNLPGPCADCSPVDGSVCVCECQRFLKRLRARLAPKRIRFFLCAEYGEKFGRPHYHAVIFGEDFSSDRVALSPERKSEFTLYDSKFLSDCWGLGDVRVGDVSFESAVYVANYATKKVNGKSAPAHYEGRKSEFLLMSRRPGVGKSWFDRFSGDVFPSDEVIVRGLPTRPPRFYGNLYDALEPEIYAEVKARREVQASKLEDMILKSGVVVAVAPSRNARRLAVRQVVAKAKLSLKLRSLENSP